MSHIQRGIASWFCCGSAWGSRCGASGGGKCGNCDSHSLQYAWPYVAPPPGGSTCTKTGTCRTLQEYSCGTSQSVYSPCTGVTINPQLADCGPLLSALCSTTKNDCAGYVGRIIDLTPSAFTALGLNLDSGLGSVVVTGVCLCHPGCPC